MTTPSPEPSPRPIAEINARVKHLVERHTKGETVCVQGLIRRTYQSGMEHQYFEIVQDDYALACFLRNSVKPTIGFGVEKGQRVEVVGEIRVYDREASVQIEVAGMRLLTSSGVVKPAQLEANLRQRGLWREQKRPLPANIRKIAVVTSNNSEAFGDFETTYRKRGGQGQPFLAPVPLQGEKAAQSIADTIKIFSQRPDVDVIVLTRGGGGRDELAVFNDSIIAEAIYQSPKTIVTGIGHESDETLADRAGDLVAITRTDAALQLITLSPHTESRPLYRWLILAVVLSWVGIIAILVIAFVLN